jgi:ribosomal protein L29
MRDEWTQEYVKYSNEVVKEKILEEINSMTVSDFQDILDNKKLDVQVDELDRIIDELLNVLFEERAK